MQRHSRIAEGRFPPSVDGVHGRATPATPKRAEAVTGAASPPPLEAAWFDAVGTAPAGAPKGADHDADDQIFPP